MPVETRPFGDLGVLGMIERYHYDHADGRMVTSLVQDVEPILNENKRLQNDPNHDGYTPSRDLRHVAQIPMVVIEQWLKEGIDYANAADWPKIAAKLDDPEYAYLRTGGGRVSSRPVRVHPTTTRGR